MARTDKVLSQWASHILLIVVDQCWIVGRHQETREALAPDHSFIPGELCMQLGQLIIIKRHFLSSAEEGGPAGEVEAVRVGREE